MIVDLRPCISKCLCKLLLGEALHFPKISAPQFGAFLKKDAPKVRVFQDHTLHFGTSEIGGLKMGTREVSAVKVELVFTLEFGVFQERTA